MAVFNEDTRVKIPATIQFLRLDYNYQSLKEDDIDIDFNERFIEANSAVIISKWYAQFGEIQYYC